MTVFYLLKEEADTHLIVEALLGIAHEDGELWISKRLATKLIRRKVKRQPEQAGDLTEQQEKVVRLVHSGRSPGEVQTVKGRPL